MWTGRQTLASIEGAISKLHGEQSQLDQALRSAVGETERLRSERSHSLRELARIKLDEMAAGRLVGNLDAGERRARQILDDYRLRITAAAEQCNALQKEVTQAEAARHAASAEVETALDVVEHDRAEAEARVQATQAWRNAKETRDKVEAIAAEAEKRRPLRKPSSVPRRSLTMRIPCSHICGEGGLAPVNIWVVTSLACSIVWWRSLSPTTVRGPTMPR